MANVGEWLRREKRDGPFPDPKMASWYLVPLLIIAGLCGAVWLRHAAAVVCVFGVAETAQLVARGDLRAAAGLASVVAHLAVLCPFMDWRALANAGWVASALVLLAVLAVYAASGEWPYSISPLSAVALGASVMIVSTC